MTDDGLLDHDDLTDALASLPWTARGNRVEDKDGRAIGRLYCRGRFGFKHKELTERFIALFVATINETGAITRLTRERDEARGARNEALVIAARWRTATYAADARAIKAEHERDAAIAQVEIINPPNLQEILLTSLSKDLQKRLDAALADAARLREALTPSAETKRAYWGEFSFVVDYSDDNPLGRTIDVPWTTIKEIMKAIRARAAVGREPHVDTEVARLREALRPFAELAREKFADHKADPGIAKRHALVPVDDLVKARAALGDA